MTYFCAWRLDQHQTILAASEDERQKMVQAIHLLNNKILQSIEICSPALETTFCFEDGFVLHLFPVCTEEHCAWMLFEPTGYVLTLGLGTNSSYLSSRV